MKLKHTQTLREAQARQRAALIIVVLFLYVQFAGAQSLPTQLTDEEFWKLSSDFSEPDGTFRSDNLLSNESWFQYVIPELNKTAKPSRVYLGVGPEQNFTYIAALKPQMVFIFDVRRGNLDLHLMYKALFELSKDRADFVSRLFSRKRPEGLSSESSARAIFAAYSIVDTSTELFKENLQAIQDHLVKTHGFPVSATDLDGIEYVYSSFHRFGPNINYNSSTRGGFGGGGVGYSDLMIATDESGQSRSYLANEQNFQVLKTLHAKNLVVPVVGNFAGPKAIRAVGQYLKDKGAQVSAFYLSNVEQYLRQDGIWDNFCRNVATLPLDESSTFIRSVRGGRYGLGTGLNSDLGNMLDEVSYCRPER
jgi:hypothetical protein